MNNNIDHTDPAKDMNTERGNAVKRISVPMAILKR